MIQHCDYDGIEKTFMLNKVLNGWRAIAKYNTKVK